jgi:chromate reductase
VQSISVLAIAGSLRARSYNKYLVHAAAELAPQAMSIDLFDLAPIPLYNADIDPDGAPPAVADFRRRIRAADALLIATPEYNYSVSGVLKNALDWASRAISRGEPPALQGKPAAIMGAGGRFGTVRAQAHLRYILLHNDVKLVNKPEVFVPRAWEMFDGDGRLTDEATRAQVAELMHALYAWTVRLSRDETPAGA